MGGPVAVGEVEKVGRLRRVDARKDGRLARIADRSRRQAGVLARVPWGIHLQLRKRGLRGQAPKPVQERRVHSEGDAAGEPVVVDAAHVAPIWITVRLAL